MGFSYKPFVVYCALICLLTEASSKNGITLHLIHRDSPLSPFYNSLETNFHRLTRSFRHSLTRHSSLNSILSSDNSSIQSILDPTTSSYLMKIYIGTPPVEVYSTLDTSSDLTWIQCQPCIDCYHQDFPIFDSSKSSTYRAVNCSATPCDNLGQLKSGCDTSDGSCLYHVSYKNNSYTDGKLAMDTLRLGSSTTSFPEVVFGCGQHNGGNMDKRGSGIVGLGGGSLSIIQQLERPLHRMFSYCLTTFDSKSSGTISFGSDTDLSTEWRVTSTPIFRRPSDSFYYLSLEYMSLEANSNSINLQDVVFEDGVKWNMLMDSGSMLSFIPRQLYTYLGVALLDNIMGEPVENPPAPFDLCYTLPKEDGFPVTVTANFAEKAAWEIPKETLFMEVQKGIACLTFIPTDGVGIFGTLHQVNYRVGFDINNQTLNFMDADCSK